MSQFLQSHQDKAAAWAEAAGIQPADMPTYVRQLTPVLLRADTYVTNHGYRDGELTSYPAVLQAGTAVLVDGYGTPRVKCYCGNPVSAPPHHRPAHFEGRPWTSFAPVAVIVIRPAPMVVQNLTVVNIENNIVYIVVIPRWQWGPPPGWTQSSSTSGSSTSGSTTRGSTTDTSSASPSVDQDGQLTTPALDCGPLDTVPLGTVATTVGTCDSPPNTTITPTTITPTTITSTTITPTTFTPTTTTTSGVSY
jgi:hypothetical protein